MPLTARRRVRCRSGVGTLLVAALALLAVLVLGGAWVHLGPTHSLHPQVSWGGPHS